MGLAASQARFLAITARKADCEYQSMQIAQQKLSITRELATVSQQYQDALNTTMLVWDYDGSGENAYDLSYGVMMTPTILNNFNPYLITTRTGSVVLNSAMANAASAISPSGAACQRSAGGFQQFMEALAANGILPSSTANDIINMTASSYTASNGTVYINPTEEQLADSKLGLTLTDKGLYDKDAGYGSTPLNKFGASSKNVYGLAYRLEDTKLATYFGDGVEIYVDGNIITGDARSNLTLGDVLTSNVYIVQQYGDGAHLWTDGPNALYDSIMKLFDESTSGDLYNTLGTDVASKNALKTAAVLTKNQFLNDYADGAQRVEADKISADASRNRVLENMVNNRFIWVHNQGSKLNSTAGISLSNLFGYYLTQFDLLYNGYDSEYSVAPTTSGCNFITSDPYYNYVMNDTDSVTNETVLKTDFYMQLYNNICINGWTESEGDIEDNDYLEQMLRNGNYFVTSLNSDGYFYQGRYNNTDCIVEIKDEDAIAQAEAEFTTKKAQLTYKEEELDLDMQNLDAEISSLTTEYDSVKNLISNNVEKVFSMFQ